MIMSELDRSALFQMAESLSHRRLGHDQAIKILNLQFKKVPVLETGLF